MKRAAKHVVFIGRVQGVGFRFTAFNVANRCQLTGMVRNIAGGNVEMIVQGNPKDIADCIRNIKETYAAQVREVKIEDIAVNPKYQDFKITF
ncbi:acylphosphatase [Planctomycetota bacterium]